mgnify:CR=1 FL=1
MLSNTFKPLKINLNIIKPYINNIPPFYEDYNIYIKFKTYKKPVYNVAYVDMNDETLHSQK